MIKLTLRAVLTVLLSGCAGLSHAVEVQTTSKHILAVRVEFQPDQVATTTGDGLFDLSSETEYAFDPPPHNRTYFDHQMKALAHYFDRVSNGALNLTYDVYPIEEEAAYSLPHDMVYYSGEDDEELQEKRWTELVRDALEAANVEGGPDFSLYDYFIVFHAGVGSDFAFDFDPTPYDIQSVFLDFETLAKTLGAADLQYRGIAAGDSVFVREAIVLPETQNQEDQNLGLLGTMTLLMGRQLGMPSLFDTEDGRAGIGRWGLMDQGSYNYKGLIPAQPCAWTRVYMGWEQPVLVTEGERISVGTSQTWTAPHIIKIPITESEYYLVENRQRDWDGNGLCFAWDEEGVRIQFDTLGRVLTSEDVGVLTRVEEYDFGLPGSGILIWHIDERVIREHLESNTINDDRDRRGVDLVECDGAQDIGFYYTFFDPAYGTETGDYYDPYWGGNLSHKIVNNGADVELSSVSIPASRSADGAVTHIRIGNFSGRDTVMTFSIASGRRQAGFPQYAGIDFAAGALLALPGAANSGAALAAVSRTGHVLAWRGDGEKLVANDLTRTVYDPGGTAVSHPYALFDSLGAAVIQPPAAGDLDGDDVPDLVVADEVGRITAWSIQDRDMDGAGDRLAQWTLPHRLSAGPVIADRAIVCGTREGSMIYLQIGQQEAGTVRLGDARITGLAGGGNAWYAADENGSLYALSPAGEFLWQVDGGSAAGHHQPIVFSYDSGGEEIALLSADGRMRLFDADGLLKRDLVLPVSAAEGVAAGDIDGDKSPELLVMRDGWLHALELTGVPVTGYPVQLDRANGPAYAPLFYPRKSDSAPVALAATPSGLIEAKSTRGRSLPGYPLSTARPLAATPVLIDLDLDQDLELMALSGDGYLYGWDLPDGTDPQQGQWTQWGGSLRTFLTTGSRPQAADGGSLLPSSQVYCYPNPAEGPETRIRYTLFNQADAVTVRIYDLAGDFLAELEGTGLEPGDHEIVWNLNGIASGVYIARVSAHGSGLADVDFIKIAVVR